MSDMLADAWNQLAASSDESSGLRRIRVEPLQYRVYAGWTVPSGQPALAAVVEASSVPADVDLPQSSGFTVSIDPLPNDSDMRLVLLQAESEQYHEVFERLAEDVRNEIRTAESEGRLINIFVARLRRWQLFLSRRRDARLSRFEQIGLWGEIWFLRSHLIPTLGIDSAVHAWRGPDGANHDFEFSGKAVEVKTSSANPEGRVHIANVLQLVDTGLDALYLRYISVSIHQGAGTALPDLILRLRQKLGASSTARQQFEGKLFDAGYLDSEDDHYRRMGIAVLSETTYLIADGFPRLLPSDLPPGVGDVKYVLSLGACQDFAVASDPFEEGCSDD
ncbi:MAG: PD-(D/E)XK motif protein [Phycisphaeraceae bacterium]